MQLLRFNQVKAITGLSRSTIFRLEKASDFPARRKISWRNVGWCQSEINDWITSRKKAKEDTQ